MMIIIVDSTFINYFHFFFSRQYENEERRGHSLFQLYLGKINTWGSYNFKTALKHSFFIDQYALISWYSFERTNIFNGNVEFSWNKQTNFSTLCPLSRNNLEKQQNNGVCFRYGQKPIHKRVVLVGEWTVKILLKICWS